jgi:general stress protein YciG
MKKAILTIGLFTIVTALTSFAKPTFVNVDNTINTEIDGNGGQDVGGNKKVDYNGNLLIANSTNKISEIDGNGGQDVGGNKKVD